MAAVIGVALFSHWVPDFLVHAPDLAIVPHSALHFGLRGATTTGGTVLAFALVLGCGATDIAAARRDRTVGRHAEWSVALLLGMAGLRAYLQRRPRRGTAAPCARDGRMPP